MAVFLNRIEAHLAWMLAIFLLTTLFAAAIFIYLQPLEYKVSSSILIRQGKKQTGADLKAELAVLQGDAIAEQVLAALGGERLCPEPGKENRTQWLQKRLLAHAVRPGTRIVEISFRHSDAALAVETVSTVIRLFGQELEKMNDPQTALLEEELHLRRKQMQQAQNVLAMFRQNDRLQGNDDWQMRYHEIKRGRLEAVLEEETQLEETLAGELAKLRQQFAALPTGDAERREEFLKMKLYRQELLRKYDAKEPLIASVDSQLARLRQQLQADEGLERLAEQIAAASAAHAKQQEEREAAQRELNQLAASLMRQAEQKETFSSLEAEVEKSRELYAQQLNKVEENRKAGVQEGYVTVIEPPQPPTKPDRPNKLRSLAAAAVIGLLVSLFWGLLRRRTTAKPN
jgi:uncharacterized protein involved in exopolysaccharide biosynthesis